MRRRVSTKTGGAQNKAEVKATTTSAGVHANTQTGGLEPIGFELPRVTEASRARAAELYDALLAVYPDAHCELDYSTPHELLVATILSAQATDVSVNKATPGLFKAFPTPAAYVEAGAAGIEPHIRTIGLYRNKAKSVYEAMKQIVEKHGGEVPRTMGELLELRGVARKTAGVVLGNAFGINMGVVVDTHVHRLSQRLGLVKPGTNVMQTERRLMALLPREQWCMISHLLIFHGRRCCKARGVECPASGAKGAGALSAGERVCEKFGVACELRVKGRGVRAEV